MAASLLRREAGLLSQLLSKSQISKQWSGPSLGCLCQCQVHVLRQEGRQLLRLLSTSALRPSEDKPPLPKPGPLPSPAQLVLLPTQDLPHEEDLYRERYIPITRRSIIRLLMEEQDLLISDEERKMIDDFALALDSAIVNKYHGILQDLKFLFDPLNPDKDTIQSRKFTRRERLDNEFWLLQQLEGVMDKANFHELPQSTVARALLEHKTRVGVKVSVDPAKYDTLRFWALGKERPECNPSWWERLVNHFLKRPPKTPQEYYKRVVVAIRLKKDSKLMLKAFKEVPVDNLEMLLPDGTIHMSTLDKGVLVSTAFIAGAGILAKIVTVMAHVKVDWMLIVTGVTGLIGIRAWTVYKNRRNAYLVDVSRMLYFKNVANNRGLLTLLVDRAEDESFKEALLTYVFLLASRSPSLKSLPSSKLTSAQLGNISEMEVERRVEDFLFKKTGVRLDFDASEAVALLKGFGILSESKDKLNVLPLDAAFRNLPQQPQSLIARAMEADLEEGYDRDEYLETEEEYKDEDKKASAYGWK